MAYYGPNHPYAKHPTAEQIDQISDASLLVEIRQAASAAEDALLELERRLHAMDYRKQSIEAHEMFEAVSKIGDAINRDFMNEPEDIQHLAEEAAA